MSARPLTWGCTSHHLIDVILLQNEGQIRTVLPRTSIIGWGLKSEQMLLIRFANISLAAHTGVANQGEVAA